MLSAEDPVRAFQNFATIDLLSRGRAEMIVGRGSSIEGFPLFGYRLEDYDALFEEKLDLLLTTRARAMVRQVPASLDGSRVSTRGRFSIRYRFGWASAAHRSLSRGPARSAFR